MKFEPLPYQDLGIDWLKVRDEAALFAGMGLGKSAMTLGALDHLFVEGAITGALIVAPKRVSTLTWPYEINKWDEFKWMKPALLRTEEGMQAWRDHSADIYLINYEQLVKFCKNGLYRRRKSQTPAQVVIWDELSKAKSQSSKRINLFRKFRDRFDKHWGLTGTPRPNGYIDLFAQVRLLDDGKRLGKAFTHFQQTYFQADNPRSDYPKYVEREGTAEFINGRISDLALTLRCEDYLDIPPTTTEDVEVDLPTKARKYYEEMEKEFLIELEKDGMEIMAINNGVKAQKLLQIICGRVYDEEKRVGKVHDAKILALKKLHKKIGEPVLVATAFRHEQDAILKAIPKAEVFDEGTLDRWSRGEIPMLVAHPASIGHGVDRLQDMGRHIIWTTPTWSRELYDQFNARLARMGQKEETTIWRLLCPDTYDDAVVEALRVKGEGQSGFMQSLKFLQDLTRAKKG